MFDKFMPQKNCLLCVDHMGYCADIVVGDAWQSRYKEDKIGTNIIVTRTLRGDTIVKKMDSVILEEGYLSEIEQSQQMYAKPFLGLSMAKENLFKDDFVANHVLSEKEFTFEPIHFSWKDKFKIISLKNILRKKYFKSIKVLYILTEVKLIVKTIIKQIIRKKI